jgi:hypothetical protein
MVRLERSLDKAKYLLLLAGLAIGGCTADASGDVAEPSASESDLTSLSVTLDQSGTGLSVDDRPRLKPRASGALACAQRFEIDGRVRVTCTRDDEQLEVIVREGEGGATQALLVHKAVRSADRKTYYACTTSGSGPDGLPKNLSCSNAPLRDRPSHGGLVSPFESTFDGIDIPNAHAVGSSGKLLRGMAPGTPAEFDQLFAANVGAVLIFKNPTNTGHDVGDEIETLAQRGLSGDSVVNIPFKWKDIGPFQAPCEQVVAGLKFIKENLAANKTTYFHCTVGEDRTGFLAAMHRLTTSREGSSSDAGNAWDAEMCEHGYGAGNPLKPGFVVGELETSLKPLYRKMAYLAKTGRLDALDTSVCATDPEGAADFEAKAPALDRLTCGTSTLFVP